MSYHAPANPNDSCLRLIVRIAWRLNLVLLAPIVLALLVGRGIHGAQLAFVSRRDGRYQIYQIDIAHYLQVNVSRNNLDNWNPSWSPDGNRLLFVAHSAAPIRYVPAIYLMNLDGSQQYRLRDPISKTGYGNLSWSPDGQFLVFYAYDDNGITDIFISDLSGGYLQNLSHDPQSNDFYPSWSPDGHEIAYVSNDLGNSDIRMVNVDTGSIRQTTDYPGNQTSLNWSPDGMRLAFVSDRDGNSEIYVMDADGSHIQRLTQNRALDGNPVWSPDGTRLAFVSDRDGNSEIYVMDADGSHIQRLTYNADEDTSPVWQP